jgi:hypothetical protein
MIPVQEEYGAELYLWASPFTHFTEIFYGGSKKIISIFIKIRSKKY